MKKFLSAILALSMVLSMVGTLGITSYASDAVTYDDFLGTQKYSTGFSWAGYNSDRTRLYGISNSSYAGAGNLRQDLYPNTHTGTFLINEMTQADGQIGQVLEARTIMGYSYATEDEINARDAGNYKVNIDGEAVNAFYYRFIPSEATNTGIGNTPACNETNDIHYLITIDSNNLKAWYPITNTGDLDVNGNLKPGTYNYDAKLVPTTGDATNRFFTPMWKGAPVMHLYGGLGKDIGLTVNSNSNQRAYFSNSYAWTADLATTKVDEKDAGTVIWSFDYKNDGQYVDGTTVPGGSINFTLFGNLTMDLHAGLVIPSSRIITVNDENKSTPDSATLYLGKTADVEGTKDSVDDLAQYPAYVPNDWNNVVVSYNLKTSVFKYYVNGKPVYAGLSDGKYYDEFYLAHTTGSFNLSTMQILMQRSSRFNDNSFYFDNIKVKYAEPETISKELIWHKISNGQSIDAITSNLKMSDTIKVDGVDCPITWKSSNENAIALNGTVTRNIATDETVTLTATVGEEEFVFENIVVLSKLGTVLVWDLISNGQGINAVTGDLSLPLTVSDGEQNFDVAWSSSNEDAISNTGKVTRGSSNTKVTLTATVEGVDFPFNIVVWGKGAIPEVESGITIDDMPGKVILTQGFESRGDTKIGQSLNSQAQYSGGFYGPGESAPVPAYIRTVPTEADQENEAIAFEPGSAYMFATAEEIDEINESQYTVTYKGGAAQKGMHREFDGNHYIITKDGSGVKAWYAIANFSEEKEAYAADESKTLDAATGKNKWFYSNGKPQTVEIYPGNVNNKIGSDMLKKDEKGNYKGVLSYNFKFMTNAEDPRNTAGFPTVTVGLSSANNIFALKHNSNVSNYSYGVYKNGEKIAISGINERTCFLGKTANVNGNKTSADELDLFSTVATRQEGQWVDYIIVMNLDDNYYSVYVDGKPLYLLYDGVYYNQFVIDEDKKDSDLLEAIKFQAGRTETYHGDFTYLDDFVVKYYYDNIYDVLTWDSISDGQAIASVMLDLPLPEKINYKGRSHTIKWTSSNPAVISTTGKVNRPDETTSVTLTATVAGEEAVFTVTVKGLTGKPSVFLIGDSAVSDYTSDSANHPELIQGWGYFLRDYFEGNVGNFVNAAEPGHGTMSFYHDPQFYEQRVKRFLQPGDFVFIELGANDEAKKGNGQMWPYTDSEGQEHSVTLGSTPEQYREYLNKYVDEIRALGAHPIFIITHFPGLGETYSEYTEYNEIMMDVAEERDVDCVNLRKSLIDYIKYLKTLETTPQEEREGNRIPEFYFEYMHVDDRVHLNAKGAMTYANWIATEISESNLPTLKSLAEYIHPDMVKPTIYTAGDSLVCDWLKVFGPKWYPYQGWGSFLGDYFEGANVVNTAESGSTIASFYYQKNLMQERVMKHILPGDYLFISSEHNDNAYANPTVKVTAEEGQIDPITGQHVAKDGKVFKVISAADSFDGEVHKFGATVDEYAENLKNLYIDEMRKRGVNVVFVTSATGYSRFYNPNYRYTNKMKEVGAANNIPVIDLRTKHQQFIVDEYGYNEAEHGQYVPMDYTLDMQPSRKVMKEKYGFTEDMIEAHPGVNSGQIGGTLEGVEGEIAETGDISHFNIEGAKVAARLAIEALYESTDTNLNELKSFLNTDKLYLNEEVAVSEVSVTDAQGGVNVKATLTKTEPNLQFYTKAILSAYSGSKLIKTTALPLHFKDGLYGIFSTLTNDSNFDYTSKATIDCTLEGEFDENTTYKLFVWDMRNLKPVASVTLAD